MKNLFSRLALPATLLALCTLNSALSTAEAQGTAFTYQGQLSSNGVPVNGSFDFEFSLYPNAAGTGSPLGTGTATQTAIGVTNGLFTTTLNFGAVFTGNAIWLAINVRSNGSGANFTALSPLQELRPAPYAIYSPNAGYAATATTADNLSSGIAITNAVITNSVFEGNGGGLTNVIAESLAATTNFLVGTLVYASNGVYNVVVPPLVTNMVVKLWGAGGSVDVSGDKGGGGAYAGVSLGVTPGQTYTVVVGQAGALYNGGGGAGSGDAPGGSDPHGTGQGGQASSLFLFTGSKYIMDAVAGGGGGASDMFLIGGGAGGNPGQDPDNAGGGGYNGIGGGNGSNYSTSALTVGETNLNLMGGAGGNASGQGYGAGGGGFGGGSGGDGTQGPSGGGSYGALIIGGSNNVPGNTSDPSYVSPQGYSGDDGLVVVQFYMSGATLPALVQAIFSGSSAYLTGLNASLLNSGTIPLAVENPAVVTNNETSVTLSGTFTGNGGGLTGLNATNLSGTIPLAAMPTNAVTNNASGVTLSGTFSGNGGGLTNLNATNLSGRIPLAAMPTNAVTNNESGVELGKFVVQADDAGANPDAQQFVIKGQSNSNMQLEIGYKTPATYATNYASIQAYLQLSGSRPLVLQPAGGNVGIGATNPANLLVVGTSASPAYCNGTTWVNGSDRNIKEHFSAINPAAVLEKVSALPITEWKYKVEADGTRHLGPVAQDFHAAFGLNGGDDTHIATVDEGGVALAAIQGLNQKLEAETKEKDAEIEKLKAKADKVDALEQQLNELKQMVQTLAEKK